jgi:tetratricopeptide (TPR) repeat protein
MNTKSLWISVIAVALSFVGGFLLANTINRGELNRLRGENEKLKTASPEGGKNGADFSLSNDEIDAKVAEADQNPTNFEFQKNLGVGLYRYSEMKQDADVRSKAIRILERAWALNKTDYQVNVGLGHANFDIGFFEKKGGSFEKARGYYQAAMAEKPNDVETRTEIGLTYFLQEQPDMAAATEEFQRSLKIDPKHEKTLQFIVQSLAKQNKTVEAQSYLDQLKKLNPSNQSITELSAMVVQPPAK